MAKEKINKKEDKTIKGGRNFRKSEEIEAYYRFVFDKDLRREAKMILERVTTLSKKVFVRKIQ